MCSDNVLKGAVLSVEDQFARVVSAMTDSQFLEFLSCLRDSGEISPVPCLASLAGDLLEVSEKLG